MKTPSLPPWHPPLVFVRDHLQRAADIGEVDLGVFRYADVVARHCGNDRTSATASRQQRLLQESSRLLRLSNELLAAFASAPLAERQETPAEMREDPGGAAAAPSDVITVEPLNRK